MPSHSQTSFGSSFLVGCLVCTLITACSGAAVPASTTTAVPASPTLPIASPEPAEDQRRDPFEGADLAITGVDGNILLVDVDSLTVLPLTSDARPDPLGEETFIAYGEPTWSPDGEKLAFIRTLRAEGQPGTTDIIIASLNEEKIEISVESERPFYLYWSPTGGELSFLASKPGEPITLWVQEIAGQATRLDQGQPYYWDWAPDGSSLLAHVGGSIDLNPEGAYLSFFSPERNELDLAPLSFQAPAYSPGGDQILVASRARIGSDALLLLDAQGEILQDIVPVEGRASFAWSSNGANFATTLGPDIGGAHIGVLSLFEMNEEGQAELVRKISEDVIAFWWSPDGGKIAYFVPVLSPPELTQPVSLNAQDNNQLFLQLFVYDLESGSAERRTSFRPTSEFLRILPYFDQYQRSATIWSADSSLIAYATIGQGGVGQIFIMAADGSQVPLRISAGQIGYWSRERR